MGTELHRLTSGISGVHHANPPAVNSVFPVLPREAIEPLQQWCFFWDWDVGKAQVRWMTAWDTTAADVEQFAAGVRHLLG
jgi:threonine aldolase